MRLLAQLETEKLEIAQTPTFIARPKGTVQFVDVELTPDRLPRLVYTENDLSFADVRPNRVSLSLFGWEKALELRWDNKPRTVRTTAYETALIHDAVCAFADYLKDGRFEAVHRELGDILQQPDWQFLADELDAQLLSEIELANTSKPEAVPRLAWRIGQTDERWTVEPVIQKPQKGAVTRAGQRSTGSF